MSMLWQMHQFHSGMASVHRECDHAPPLSVYIKHKSDVVSQNLYGLVPDHE